MTIYIDTSLGLGFEGEVFDLLIQIARCDPGIESRQETAGALQVFYQQKQAGVASSNRLLDLVNSPQEVLIIGVDSTAVVPGPNVPITAFFGAVTLLPELTRPTWVIIDVTDCGGSHYCVNDSNSRKIYSPGAVGLYHELSHVYHHFRGDLPADQGPAEIQAIADENTFRSQLSLPLRSSMDYAAWIGMPETGGLDFPRCEIPYKPICIVATAATGSATTPTVTDLRRARDQYRDLGDWANQIAEPVLAQYWRFAPGVVREMEADEALREAVLIYTVRPVARLLEVVEAELDSSQESTDPIARANAVLAAYAAEAAAVGCSEDSLLAAAEGAAAAARTLAAGESFDPIDPATRHAPENLFGYFGAEIAAGGRETDGFAWGLEGLALFLRRAAAALGDGATLDFGDLIAFASWLGRLPIPAGAELEVADAPRELRILSEGIFARPEARAMFAQRLLEHWPEDDASAALTLLGEHGFEPSTEREES